MIEQHDEKRKGSPAHAPKHLQAGLALLLVLGLCLFLRIYQEALLHPPTFNRSTSYLPVFLLYAHSARTLVLLSALFIMLFVLGFAVSRRSTLANVGVVILFFLSSALIVANVVTFNFVMHINFYNEVPAHGKLYRLLSIWTVAPNRRVPMEVFKTVRCDADGVSCFYHGVVESPASDYRDPYSQVQPEIFVETPDGKIRFRIGDVEYPIISDGVGD